MDWIVNKDQFKTIVPFPEAGPNSFRPEVLLGAFADLFAYGTEKNMPGFVKNIREENTSKLNMKSQSFRWIVFQLKCDIIDIFVEE